MLSDAGKKKIILWGEVYKVGNELFWCEGGAKLPSEAVISGDMDKPFFLISYRTITVSNVTRPNLSAISLFWSINIKLNEAYCLYNQRIVELCNNGNRTKQLTFFEKLLKKYNLNVNV
jgi:hypothetical protein